MDVLFSLSIIYLSIKHRSVSSFLVENRRLTLVKGGRGAADGFGSHPATRGEPAVCGQLVDRPRLGKAAECPASFPVSWATEPPTSPPTIMGWK